VTRTRPGPDRLTLCAGDAQACGIAAGQALLGDVPVKRPCGVAGLGGVVGEYGATEFKTFIDRDYETVQKIVKSAGMKPD
jgi:hypothetical protein